MRREKRLKHFLRIALRSFIKFRRFVRRKCLSSSLREIGKRWIRQFFCPNANMMRIQRSHKPFLRRHLREQFHVATGQQIAHFAYVENLFTSLPSKLYTTLHCCIFRYENYTRVPSVIPPASVPSNLINPASAGDGISSTIANAKAAISRKSSSRSLF